MWGGPKGILRSCTWFRKSLWACPKDWGVLEPRKRVAHPGDELLLILLLSNKSEQAIFPLFGSDLFSAKKWIRARQYLVLWSVLNGIDLSKGNSIVLICLDRVKHESCSMFCHQKLSNKFAFGHCSLYFAFVVKGGDDKFGGLTSMYMIISIRKQISYMSLALIM